MRPSGRLVLTFARVRARTGFSSAPHGERYWTRPAWVPAVAVASWLAAVWSVACSENAAILSDDSGRSSRRKVRP
jgi:hypothetical protein